MCLISPGDEGFVDDPVGMQMSARRRVQTIKSTYPALALNVPLTMASNSSDVNGSDCCLAMSKMNERCQLLTRVRLAK